MRRRKVHVELTRPQIDALVEACVLADASEEGEQLNREEAARRQSRDRAIKEILWAQWVQDDPVSSSPLDDAASSGIVVP